MGPEPPRGQGLVRSGPGRVFLTRVSARWWAPTPLPLLSPAQPSGPQAEAQICPLELGKPLTSPSE